MSTDRFFDSPEQQSIVKTQLVAKYFGAWAKIMLHRANRAGGQIAYVDLFSGPGEFIDGTESTPLRVLNYARKDPSLCTNLVTVFNEKNRAYVEQLRSKIDALHGIERLTHRPIVTNNEVGPAVIDLVHRADRVPTLFFVDPWGYKGLSLELVGNAIKRWGCDCIFFFNYNRVNLGLNNPLVIERMNELFGIMRADSLREKIRGLNPDERQAAIVNDLSEALRDVGGRHVLPFEFRSQVGDRTSHHIIFVSKSFLGYHIMKNVMYRLSSDDGKVRSFEHIPTKSPQLPLLFELAQPHSIAALKEVLIRSCSGMSLAVSQVYERCTVDTPYTLANVQDALRALEEEQRVSIDPPAEIRPKRRGQVTLAENKVVTFPS